jgi:putative transposase
MHELAAQPRYGYRRIQVFLGRCGHAVSTDRARRLRRLDGCKCRENGHGGVWWPVAHGRCDVAGSIRSGRVIDVLSKSVSVHGGPKHLRSDGGN